MRRTVVAAVIALTLAVGVAPAHAATGVTVLKPPNYGFDDDTYFPDAIEPSWTKSGPVVVDKAVVTVKDSTTGALIGAGRTRVNVDPGEYKVTTTVKYRTFTTTGTTKRTVAATGDTVPGKQGYDDDPSGPFIRDCAVKTFVVTKDLETESDTGEGTFTARCEVRWGTTAASSVTDYTNVSGVFRFTYSEGDNTFGFAFQAGDTYTEGAPVGTARSRNRTVTTILGLTAPASHDVIHDFPVRKYSTTQTAQATHTVRRIIK